MTSASDKTKKKRPPPKSIAAHCIKPGQVLNPKGRPKGSRSAFAETFLKDFLADWEDHGAEAIVAVREEDPAAYLRVAASILPKELNIVEGSASFDRMLEKLDDKELDNLINGLVAIGAGGGDTPRTEGKDAPQLGTKPDKLH